MISRRDVMTAGVVGTFAGLTGNAEARELDSGAVQFPSSPSLNSSVPDDVREVLSEVRGMQTSVRRINTSVSEAARVTGGALADLRERFALYLRTTGRFPEYIDVGIDVFYEAYDWHVRHQQPLQLSRQAGSRLAIVFMFTQLVLRPEQERTFIGVPYDGA